MEAVPVSGLGGTFNGNPAACAAALKVLEIYKKENLIQRAEELGRIAMDRLEEMKDKYAIIGDVRGLGCAIGIEFVKDRNTKEPDAESTKSILKYCHEHGLILLPCGTYKNVIRFMFPLVIKEEEMLLGVDILDNAIENVT